MPLNCAPRRRISGQTRVGYPGGSAKSIAPVPPDETALRHLRAIISNYSYSYLYTK